MQEKNGNVINTTVKKEEIITYDYKDIESCKNMKWEDMNIPQWLCRNLRNNNFIFPTPVQAKTIPYTLNRRNLMVRAKNGTGKTASFMIPILSKIDPLQNKLQAIVLVPIRELALQISKNFRLIASKEIKSMPLIGGTNLTDDILRFNNGVHILIGTPGRIVNILKRNDADVSTNPIIIFDEADKLLDSIFYESINTFLKIIPQKRQICLYSATFPKSIEGFVDRFMGDPVKISVSRGQDLPNIDQYFVKVNSETKIPCLKSLLESLVVDQCIIYCNSIQKVKLLAEDISKLGFPTYFIHSQMSQEERNHVYHNFSKCRCKILVSTDITTRGIDVPTVNVVINFDLPFSSESYLHRVGRCGRFGKKGCAVNMTKNSELSTLKAYCSNLRMRLLSIADKSFSMYCKRQ
ncbi:hypothetical protein NUSPORA_01129 [Nucleospora cyclopteri]